MNQEWLIGLSLAVITALVGVIYGALKGRQDRQDNRLEHHIEEDVTVHERVAVIESKVGQIEREQSGIRIRLHDMANDVTKMMGRLFKDDQR